MKVSVYISAEQIQAIEYDGKVIKRFLFYPLPEGAMYNGTIIDHALVLESLIEMDQMNPGLFKGEVSLIVDGSSLLSRKIASPKLSKKRYLNLVRDEFADSFETPDEIVCGYRLLPEAENSILGFAANKAQVESYVSVFNEAGIRLHAIHIGTEAVLDFVNSIPELSTGIKAFNIIDGMTMLTMIFVDGSSVFMSRSRLFGDNREQKLDNILSNLNGLMQFTQSQKLGQITDSYYLGLTGIDIGYLEEHNVYEEIHITSCFIYDGRGDTPPPEMHFCCFNMLLDNKAFDLITALKELDKYIKSKKPKKTWLIVLILLFLVLAAPSVLLFLQVMAVEKDVAELDAFVNAPEVEQRLTEINVMKDETAKLAMIAMKADEMTEWKKAIPLITGNMLDAVIFHHNVDIFVTDFNFDEKDEVIRITATCTSSTAPNDYINAIVTNAFVRDINYLGFSGNDGEVFTFSVDIFLNTGGQR